MRLMPQVMESPRVHSGLTLISPKWEVYWEKNAHVGSAD